MHVGMQARIPAYLIVVNFAAQVLKQEQQAAAKVTSSQLPPHCVQISRLAGKDRRKKSELLTHDGIMSLKKKSDRLAIAQNKQTSKTRKEKGEKRKEKRESKDRKEKTRDKTNLS